ncbi:MAG: hypothetical protein QM638_07195 [Nocardioides sp.]|uniref:hypothetical protein n=1 Tax=Nocardioides sp. TaxID=35761 RepID=UPI0039E41D1E
MPLRSRLTTVGAAGVLVLAAGATALGASPATAATCDPTSSAYTVAIANTTVAPGARLQISGTGWCASSTTGSRIGLKIDDGAYSRTDTSLSTNKTIWAIIDAEADGTFETAITLPDGTTATSDPAFPDGSHTLRLLSGSLQDGDAIRTLESDAFTVTSTAVIAGKPSIAGTAKVGKKLTAKPGSWTNGTTLAYRWKRNGTAVKGATKATYALTAADAGKRISVTVTGTKSGLSPARATSAAKTIAKGTLSGTKPTIKGTTKVGKKLVAKHGTWTTGTKLTYQWLANGKKIKGATKAKLKLKAAQKGKKISVKITGTKTGYTTLAKTSATTAKVTG